jgi:hypothetical protein
MTCILEINDADLTVYHDREAVFRSPAVAVVQGDGVIFGRDALALSRIHPRQTHQQYFARLSIDPLPGPGGRVRHHADLVYLHLQALKPIIDEHGGRVLLAVPGVLSADQLGVLLGVMQEAGIDVTGFVDSAVAAACGQPGSGRAFHLDLMLQRAVLTELDRNGDVARISTQEIAECGIARLLDGWVNTVADRFVRETRFDPLHAAATEQQVFDQVYGWLDHAFEHGDLIVEVTQSQQTRRVDLTRATLEDKAAQRLAPLLDALPDSGSILLTPRTARLPGLVALLTRAGAQTQVLPDDALARGFLEHLERITGNGDDLRLVTRLPRSGGTGTTPATGSDAASAPESPAAAPVEDSVTAQRATHALRGTRALPLSAVAAQLGIEHDGDGYRVQPGDRIHRDGEDFLIIQVET